MRKLVKGAVAAGKAARRVQKSSDKKGAIKREAGAIGEGVGEAAGGLIPIPGAAKLGKKLGKKLGEKVADVATSDDVLNAARDRLAEFHGAVNGTPPNPFLNDNSSSTTPTITPDIPGGPKNPFAQ